MPVKIQMQKKKKKSEIPCSDMVENQHRFVPIFVLKKW